VTEAPKQEQPGAVPETARRGGEIRSRWDWVEGSVWTERMLAALEQGVKGDHWRWPNVYFAKQGLFSLELAHAQACQSSRR
jgi:hypothetical protein